MIDFNEISKKRIVYALPGMEQCRVSKDLIYKSVDGAELQLDVYYPADLREGERRPAVVFVHGLGPDELIKHIKDSGQYVSWGQLIAASGLIAVIFNHRSPEGQLSFEGVWSDVEDLKSYLFQHAEPLRIDTERLAIWTASAGVPLGSRLALEGAPPFVKCLVAYYGPLDMEPLKADWGLSEREVQEYSAITYLREHAKKLAPMLIVKAGIDDPGLNASIDTFITEASKKNIALDYLIHPAGQHAFDILDDLPRSREIIQRTLEFLKSAL